MGGVHILAECSKYGVEHVVYASSSSVYGDAVREGRGSREIDVLAVPLNPYAASKQAFELFADAHTRLHGLSAKGLRFFTVYGPRGRPDMAAVKFLTAVRDGAVIRKYGEGTSRDYTYIDDIVRGIAGALDTPEQGVHRIYNLGTAVSTPLDEFVRVCEEVVGARAVVALTAPHLADARHTLADATRARIEIGYAPRVGLKEGLALTYAWLATQAERAKLNV